MNLYEVLLGVDRAARDTGKRLRITAFGEDKLSAALNAEATADPLLSDPMVEYTHAMDVKLLRSGAPATALPVAA